MDNMHVELGSLGESTMAATGPFRAFSTQAGWRVQRHAEPRHYRYRLSSRVKRPSTLPCWCRRGVGPEARQATAELIVVPIGFGSLLW